MDTEDYIKQCMIHLSDTTTYRLALEYPDKEIERKLSSLLSSFQHHLEPLNKRLYKYLTVQPKGTHTPQFYAIPKIHKKYHQYDP